MTNIKKSMILIVLSLIILNSIMIYKINKKFNNINIINDNTNVIKIDEIKTISKKLEKYNKFNNLIINNSIKVKLDNSLIPQGITFIDKYIYISGYFEIGNKSEIIIFDLAGNIINKVKLDTNSHVGSISYDKNNNLVWIPGNNGNLLAYKKDDFYNNNSVKSKLKIDYVKDNLFDYINTNKYNIAFLTIDDNYIYVGNFYQSKKCLVKKYFINNDNNEIRLDYINEFKLPSKVQGISFYHRDNKTYLITSNSYNRFEKSKLKIYEYDESIEDYSHKSIKVYEMPPMSEQVSIYNNYGFLIFESGAKKYYNASDKVKNIIILDLNKIFDAI